MIDNLCIDVINIIVMKEIEIGVEEGFYQAVADLLKCSSDYRKYPFTKRTRWNNRSAGNGRFIGHGLIRFYGPTNIHITLNNPKINGLFSTVDSALEAIKTAL